MGSIPLFSLISDQNVMVLVKGSIQIAFGLFNFF